MENLLELIGKVADRINLPCYVIGGYVRDKLLGIENDDIDIVVVGDGVKMADEFAKEIHQSKVLRYERYGTAAVKYNNLEVEFVGARKESYSPDSRKPSVVPGTLYDDQMRRDFTINTIAMCLNEEHFGEYVDPFDGRKYLKNKIIMTPTDPMITFKDDPLRMFRAIRFTCKLGFLIDSRLIDAMKVLKDRIKILTPDRIGTEFLKIMASPDPVAGIELLDAAELLEMILPELTALKAGNDLEGHKDNYKHSLQVLRNIVEKTTNPYLRIAALLHDIGKASTQRLDPVTGEWTFYNHEHIGANLIPGVLDRLRIGKKEYIQKLVDMHMRPAMISTSVITDSAVRRLIYDAGENLEDLLLLCESDVTSRRPSKRIRLQDHYDKLRKMISDLREKDLVRLFQPCLGGNEIMGILGIGKGRMVGLIKDAMKEAVLDGVLENTPEALENFIKIKYNEFIENRNA